MKLFFISDIHGNYFALKAILAKADELNADQIFCLGDLSGYFTGIKEVIELLKENKVRSIRGNHDAFLNHDLDIDTSKSYYKAYLRTLELLNDEDLLWIKQLPLQLNLDFDNTSIAMYHGGPNRLLEEYIFPDHIKIEEFSSKNERLFAFGHTHLQFAIQILDKTFINPGAVGLARNGDFRAQGMMVDLQKGAVEAYAIPYDVNGALKAYTNEHVANKFLHNINFGRSSNKELIDQEALFLDEKIIIQLENRKISIINTKFGLILAKEDTKFLEQILYVSAYADGTIEITSNTLVYHWENDEIEKNEVIKLLQDCLKNDNAGLHYSVIFSSREEFIKKILPEVERALTIIENFKNKNVKI